MSGPSIAVLADDLTGAAEIAAIGNRHGLPSRIVGASSRDEGPFAGLLVYDSDSRLLRPEDAAQRTFALARLIAKQNPTFIYKKTDSVLRGNVLAECAALAESTGRRRILLAPANPSLGRTISKGQYFIQGVPLHQTAFSRDPHHPAKSARVIDLLGLAPGGWPLSVSSSGTKLATQGIVVGEASSASEVERWANCVDAQTLPAGGAEFFTALLKVHGFSAKPSTAPKFHGPACVITGALTPARDTLIAHATTAGWSIHTLTSDLPKMASLPSNPLTLIQSPKLALDDDETSQRIRQNFGQLIRQSLATSPLGHLVVEGGATAAAISEANGWTAFDVAGEWSSGVIALRPVQRPDLLFTIKPGSYAWPENLWRQLDHCLSLPTVKS